MEPSWRSQPIEFVLCYVSIALKLMFMFVETEYNSAVGKES